MPAACGCFRQAPEHHFGIASEILRRDAPQDRHPWWGLLLTITVPIPLFFVSVASTDHESQITRRRPARTSSWSLRVERLQLGIHKERIIELRHFTPTLAEDRKEARRKRLVPFHRQTGHVADNQRQVFRANVARERNRVN